MNWDAIGALSEAIGALMVVGSLLFVGFQVRHSVREARAATMHNVMSGWVDFYQRLSEDEKLSEIVRTGSQDIACLTDQERFRFMVLATGMFRNWHNAWYQWQLGVYDTESWESQMQTIKGYLSFPGSRAMWDERKSVLPVAFQRYIEAQCGSAAAAGPPG